MTRRAVPLWNWKSAALSAVTRATLFLAANASAGWGAAWGAFGAELALRGFTSGFYGAATQTLATARPAWAPALAALVGIPALSHGLEFVVHSQRGTPELGRSIGFSVLFTVVSTTFNLFVMRRGALVAGAAAEPLTEDLRRMPRLVVEFLAYPFR